ncbi:hypothetical protein CPB83DRAFT_929274 [Crepidotus variabilis]|uniref:pyranose dehydrogenase (acceptor) n=1 Tax=Crepidotus variabilis TaxID=179855 RepID=A0A9P6EGE7_9AGAR|nr:hypothetical protein CPB83DRAFT_929274 [Crepidotus variabilis]
MVVKVFCLVLGFALLAIARIYERFEDLPVVKYDYVIVGAGTAGNVLANRLTENAKVQVLVIEAGPSDEGVLAATAPFLAPKLTPNTPYDWNYTVVPQIGLNNRTYAQPRGRLLGGSSSANFLLHQFGSSDDYDRLARITGDVGWSWSKMKKYIFKHEKIVPPTDNHNTSGQYVPANHGTIGMVSVSLRGFFETIDAKVIAASKELSSEFPHLPDGATPENILGLGWAQQTVGGGVRSSSSTSYLRNANTRPNLSVLIKTQVIKLINTGSENGRPAFRGVEFATGPSQPVNFVFAKKEVILSAGSIGTPRILLLSGIGPRDDLAKVGIQIHIDNPSVGDNLSDHVLIPNVFEVRGNASLDGLQRDPAQLQSALDEWTASKTGVIANSRSSHIGFFRLPKNSTLFLTTADPASGPKAAHWEMIVSNFWNNPSTPLPPTGNFLSLTAVLISPTSRGSVKLASADPFDKPLINPKMVTTEFDKFAVREAVRAVKRFAAAKAWSDYVIGPYGSLAGTSDAEIDSHVRQGSSSIHHPLGTAAISSADARKGVVDQNLKVKGAMGLRVVDASVWPFLPSAHTQGPTYLVAERAADIVILDSQVISADYLHL